MDMDQQCGKKVKTVIGAIEGIVTAQCTRFDKTTYEISYFYNGEYKTAWMNENEFCESGNNTIGFKQK